MRFPERIASSTVKMKGKGFCSQQEDLFWYHMSLSVCVFLVAFKAQPFCCWMECRFRDISKIWMVPLTASTTLDISSIVVMQLACAVHRYIFAYHRMNKLNCIISWWELGHPWRLQAINKVLAHGSLVISWWWGHHHGIEWWPRL